MTQYSCKTPNALHKCTLNSHHPFNPSLCPPPAVLNPWDYHNSASENPLYFKFPIYSSGLFVYNCPSNFSFFSVRVFIIFVFQTCLYFCCSLLVQNYNSLLFPDQPILNSKITGSLIFKVDTCKQKQWESWSGYTHIR